MSLKYLKEAIDNGDDEKLIRYVRLHFGDGDEKKGEREIDKSWIQAVQLLLELPETDREWILASLDTQTPETLAQLYFHLHFYFAKRSGEWIHDGEL